MVLYYRTCSKSVCPVAGSLLSLVMAIITYSRIVNFNRHEVLSKLYVSELLLFKSQKVKLYPLTAFAAAGKCKL